MTALTVRQQTRPKARHLPALVRHGAGQTRAAWHELRYGLDLGPGVSADIRAKAIADRLQLHQVLARIGLAVLAAWTLALCLAVWSVERNWTLALSGAGLAVLALWYLLTTPVKYLAYPVVFTAGTAAAWAYAGWRIPVVFGAELAVTAVIGCLALAAMAWRDGSVLDNLGIARKDDTPTPDLVRRALAAPLAPIGARRDELAAQVESTSPVVTRPDGGYMATANLPEGVTAAKIIAGTQTVASVLKRPTELVDVVRDGPQGSVRVIVHGRDPRDIPATHSAFALAPCPTSIHDPFRLGGDHMGSTVQFRITDGPLLIGGHRGSGKTVAECQLIARALCDPNVDTLIGDGKKVDTIPIKDVAARWAGSDIDELVCLLEDANSRMEANREQMLCIGETELTRDLSIEHGIREIVIVVDEMAWYLRGGRWSKAQRGAVEDLTTILLEYGRAFGVHVVVCTQTPTVDVITRGIQAQLVQRLAFASTDATVSNAILGGDAAGLGWRTDRIADTGDLTDADDPDVDGKRAGVGVLRRGGRFRRLRVDYFDKAVDLRRVAGYVEGFRGELGLLDRPGVVEADPVLAGCSMVFEAEGVDRLSSAALAGRLGYDTPEALADDLRPHGIRPRVVRLPGGTQARGYLASQFEAVPTPVPPPYRPRTDPVPDGAAEPVGTGWYGGRYGANVIPLRGRYAPSERRVGQS